MTAGGRSRALFLAVRAALATAVLVLLMFSAAPAQDGEEEDDTITPIPSREHLYPGANPERDAEEGQSGESQQNRSTGSSTEQTGSSSSSAPAQSDEPENSRSQSESAGDNPARTDESTDQSDEATAVPASTGGEEGGAAEQSGAGSTDGGDAASAQQNEAGQSEGAEGDSAPAGGESDSASAEQDADAGEAVGLSSDTQLDTDADTTEGAGQEELNLETGSPLSEWSLWRGIGAVFIVLGLVLVAAWLIRKLRGGSSALAEGSGLNIKEAIGLGGGKRVMILQTSDEELVLGVTDERITLLSRQPRGYSDPESEFESGEWRELEEEERRLAEDDGWEPEQGAESRRWRSSQVLSEQEIYGEDAGGGAASGAGVEVEGEEELGHAGEQFLSELRDKLDEWEP